MLLAPGRYAAVTATAALVIALGGTSYAAMVITGADIRWQRRHHRHQPAHRERSAR